MVDESEEYIKGRDDGLDGLSKDDNPYEEGTYSYDDWEEGRRSVFTEIDA